MVDTNSEMFDLVRAYEKKEKGKKEKGKKEKWNDIKIDILKEKATGLNQLKLFDFVKAAKEYVSNGNNRLNHGVPEFEMSPMIKESVPLSYEIAEFICNQYIVYASNSTKCVYVYNSMTGCFIRSDQESFGQVLTQMFQGQRVVSLLTSGLKKAVFDVLVDEYTIQVDFNYFDNQERFVNVLNGVVDIKTGKLEKHDAKYGFLTVVPLNYKEEYAMGNKIPKLFGKTLKDTFPEKEDQVRFLQCFAYLLSNRYTNKVAFYWLGAAHTGKSTFQRLLTRMVGEEHVSNLPINKFSDKFAVASLSDKKLNICGETGKASIRSLDTFKALLGNDVIDGEYKGKDHFFFRGKTKCLFAGNNMLNIGEDAAEDAVFTRFEFILFQNPVKKSKQISFFDKKLFEEEGDKILSVLIRVLRNWYKADCLFKKSAMSKQLKKIFKAQNKPVDVLNNFLEDRCKFKSTGEVSINHLVQAYKVYCEQNGFVASTDRMFIKELIARRGLKKARMHHTKHLQFWGIRGIELKAV